MSLTDLLHLILQRLDLRIDGALIVTADEIQQWPEDGLAHLQTWNLLTPIQPRKQIECDGCEERCIMPVKVIPKSDRKGERAFIACDKRDDIDIVPVEFERLQQWRIDPHRIATSLNSLLKIDQTPQIMIQDRLWRLGMAEIAGARRDVFFARGLNWADGDRIFDEIGCEVTSTESFLLIPYDTRGKEIQSHVTVISLLEALFVENGQLWVDTKLLESTYRQNRQKLLGGVESIELELKPTFRKDGEKWTLSFENQTVYMKDRDGMAYIAYLLHRPIKGIKMLDLYYEVKGALTYLEGAH